MALDIFTAYQWMTIQRWLSSLFGLSDSQGLVGIAAPTVAIANSIMCKTEYPRSMFAVITPRSDLSFRGVRTDGCLIHPHMLSLASYPSQGSKNTVFHQIRITLADRQVDMLKYRLAVLDIRYQNCLPTDWII